MSSDKFNLSELIYNVTLNANVPLVFRRFINNWPLTEWNVDKWCSLFGDREVPFRSYTKYEVSDEPCWERKCQVKNMTFKEFHNNSETRDEWMYFDYKYVHKWFNSESDLFKEISWKQFGYDIGAADSTLWVGSRGAHTPAHQDTYGYNIVAQIYGKKRWVLFPPETGGLKPTRVPYEESSIYSELNFHCPNNLDDFKGLTGGRVVELTAGDALLVPNGWWHYVQNMEPLNISLNIWLPHENDISSQVSEALVKMYVAQICKHLPDETTKLIVNPNEDDIMETPLAVLFLQLETVTNKYLDRNRKTLRAKRQRTTEENAPVPDKKTVDLKAILDDKTNCIELTSPLTSDDLINLLKDNIRQYTCKKSQSEEELDSIISLGLTKAVIDAYTKADVIDLVKQNLLARLS